MFAKKSLGQNFLTSQPALEKIISASRILPSDIILEVGPGKGALTDKILATGCSLIAIEKDDRLISFLNEKYADARSTGSFKLIHGDILEINQGDIGLTDRNFKIIANIPYYITGQFIRKFLETDIQPSLMTLMVQKEVAKRIIAADGKESLLSLSVKAYGMPHYVQTVKAGSFSPAPAVDSAILVIDSISKDFFRGISEARFFEIIKAGFAHKRKLLTGNLGALMPREHIEKAFASINLSLNVRAEDLSLNQWKELVEALS